MKGVLRLVFEKLILNEPDFTQLILVRNIFKWTDLCYMKSDFNIKNYLALIKIAFRVWLLIWVCTGRIANIRQSDIRDFTNKLIYKTTTWISKFKTNRIDKEWYSGKKIPTNKTWLTRMDSMWL